MKLFNVYSFKISYLSHEKIILMKIEREKHNKRIRNIKLNND